VWADALPNLLIGLREGLEAGLVVSILLAAVHKASSSPPVPGDSPDPAATGPGVRRWPTAPVWFGVAAAVVLALSFGAVLTFYRSVLSPSGQEALGGTLSVVAVVLVTGMVFWMRQTARTLSAQLRVKVDEAMRISAAALALTAFLAVGREGVETALFLWTTAQVSGQTAAPAVGAILGIAAAVVLCALLYRSAVRLDLGKFFGRTALLLIVIAAGVLAYGLGDLQDAGWLPGHTWLAFDLSQHIDPGAWWVTLITGVTELSPTMTWLQVVAWLVYLVTVLSVFVRATSASRPAALAPAPADPVNPRPNQGNSSPRRIAVLAGAALVIPPVLAALLIAFAPGADHSNTVPIQVTAQACAPGWSSAHAGSDTFAVANKSGHTVEINLISAASQGIAAEIETLGPATTQNMTVALQPGGYFFRCLADGLPTTNSPTVRATGVSSSDNETGASSPIALTVKPISVADLQPAATAYDNYVQPQLATLLAQVSTLRADLASDNTPAAQRDWMGAQLTWEQVGAAYDSFGDLGDAIDGLPQAQQGGVTDPGFTGLHRIEYGLWHNQSGAQLVPIADQLKSDITTLQSKLPQITVDPTDMPVRAHEILEDALRDHLNGLTDEGSGAAYPETYADVQGTRVVLGMLAPLITVRDPHLLPTVDAQLDTLQRALLATQSPSGTWQPVDAVPRPAHERVDAAVGAVLENLSLIPDLLEVPVH
jgi:high-affinity iron transporter